MERVYYIRVELSKTVLRYTSQSFDGKPSISTGYFEHLPYLPTISPFQLLHH